MSEIISGTLTVVSFPSIRMVVTVSPASVLIRMANRQSLLSGARNLQAHAGRDSQSHDDFAGFEIFDFRRGMSRT